MVESLRDEAARAYKIRYEKYSLSKAEQDYLKKIFNAVEIATPSYLASTTDEERKLYSEQNNNDFEFNEQEGYKELLTKFAKKIKAIKRHNKSIQEQHPIMFALGISTLDSRDLEAAFYYIKYHHYNFNGLMHEESTYAIRANDKKDRYKQFELDEEIYESEKASLKSSKPSRYNLSASSSPRAKNEPQAQNGIAPLLNNQSKPKEDPEKLNRKKIRQSFVYSAKNIINMLKNTSSNPFSTISSLRNLFENKVAEAKTKMKRLILKANKKDIIQRIHTGALPIFADYHGVEPVGIINHEQLKNLVEKYDLSNLPPTPQKPKPVSKRIQRGKSEQITGVTACPASTAPRQLQIDHSDDSSEGSSISVISRPTQCESSTSVIQQDPESQPPLSAQSLSAVLTKLKSSEDNDYRTVTSDANEEEALISHHVLKLVPSSKSKVPELSARVKISGNIAQIVNTLIESDKSPIEVVSKDSLAVDKYIERAKDKLVKLDNIIEKSNEVIKYIKSKGNNYPLKPQIKNYEHIINEATRDIHAIKHMARYNGLLLWSEQKKSEYHDLSTLHYIQYNGTRMEDTPNNTPQPTPRSTPAPTPAPSPR